ncbi:MAG TPA: FmdB family zinc ribbon protein [Acidimicrobiales bacterium]|nr:FmdB family zinc ribbon protein [Acidimicrobiales bacterium]
MPTYQYRCKACGDELEVQQSFTDDALTTCPACGEEQLKKVFGNIAVTFKGSGFYKTDSRSSSGASSSSSSETKSESSSSSESKTESTSETKSESTTETKKKADTPAAAAS